MGVLLRFSWIMIKVSVIVLFIIMDTVIIVDMVIIIFILYYEHGNNHSHVI